MKNSRNLAITLGEAISEDTAYILTHDNFYSMGTRADFYIKRKNKKIEQSDWIGSIAFDGYKDGIRDNILQAKTETEFRENVMELIKSRDDGILPIHGWPWAWNTSDTTDCQYVFSSGKTRCGSWGSGYIFPSMEKYKNKNSNSGFTVIRG